jgi:ABC-type multidrug transport system fused ATPase/permease subunit
MRTLTIYVSIVGAICWFFTYVYAAFWQHLAENISFNLRTRYLRALLKQEIAFFEKQNIEALPSMIAEYFATISISIGEK